MELTKDQKEAIRFVWNLNRAVIVMDTGMGKTYVSLSLSYILKKKSIISRTIVFTHKQGVESFRKSTLSGMSVLYIEAKSDLQYLTSSRIQGFDLVVVSTSIFMQRSESEWRKVTSTLSGFNSLFDLVFIDEIHKYKNFNTKTTKGLRGFLRGLHCRIYGMTATPFWNKPLDIFWIYTLLVSNMFSSYDSFFNRYVIWQEKYVGTKSKIHTGSGSVYAKGQRVVKEIIGYQNISELIEYISKITFFSWQEQFDIHFRVETYSLDNPQQYYDFVQGKGLDKIFKCVFIDSKNNFHTYSRLRNETFYVSRGEKTVEDIRVGDVATVNKKELTLVKKTESDSDAEYIRRIVPLQLFLSKSDEKYEKLKAIIPEKGCIVFCSYRNDNHFDKEEGGTIFYLQRRLQVDFKGRKVIVLTGGDKDLTKKVSSVKEGDIVLMTKVASQSLDFYLDTIIVYELLYSIGELKQLIGRSLRMNADYKDVYVYFLISIGTIEQYKFERLIFLIKESPYEDLKRGLDSSLTEEQKRYYREKGKVTIGDLKKTLLWRK